MKHALVLFLAFALLPAVVCAEAVQPVAESDGCDMGVTEKAQYCQFCSEILAKENLVSKEKYYQCGSCEEISKTPGECEDCEVALVEHVSGDNVCRHCYGAPVEVDVCVKQVHVCPGCEATSAAPGKCEDCDEELVEQLTRALIEYECAECGAYSVVAGKCTDEDCENFDKPLKRSCSQSGIAPHASTK